VRNRPGCDCDGATSLKSSVTVPVAIVMGRLCFIVLAALLVFIMSLSVIDNRNRDGYATFLNVHPFWKPSTFWELHSLTLPQPASFLVLLENCLLQVSRYGSLEGR